MLISNNSTSGIVDSIITILPPIFTRKTTSVLYKFIEGIAEAFKIVLVDKFNDLYNQSFIMTATSGELDDLIDSKIHEKRYNNETDEQYRERYIKYVFEYNCTEDSLKEQVYDISGDYPTQMLELNARNGYWGKHNLPLSGQISGNTYYYNDTRKNVIWGGDTASDKAFVGYIFLNERPDEETIFKLRELINKNRLYGTQLYFVVNEQASAILPVNINNTYLSEIDEITISWS